MPQPIHIDEMLKLMAKTDSKGKLMVFSIEAVTFDEQRNKGGERIYYAKAILASPGGNKKTYHNRNDTRRIRLIPSDEIRTIQPLLATKFNEREVYI